VRKMLMAAVAAVLSFASTVRAADTLPKADPLIGTWCFIKKEKGEGYYDPNLYARKTNDDDDCTFLTITRDGYNSHSVECVFTRVKRRRGGGYATHVSCDRIHGSVASFEQDVEFWIVNKMLRNQFRHLKDGAQ